MAQEKVFSNTFSVSALAVYEEFDSAGALADMNLQQLTEFLIQKRKNRFLLGNLWRNPFRKLPEVLTVYPKAINDSVNQVLSISIISMKALEAQIKSFNNKVFYAQMELIPNTLTSVNGNRFRLFYRYHCKDWGYQSFPQASCFSEIR